MNTQNRHKVKKMGNVDIQAVRELRERLRRALPRKDDTPITDEFLSGSFGLMTELLTLRIVQDKQQEQGRFLSVEEVTPIQEAVSQALNQACSEVVLKYIPDATVFHHLKVRPKGTE